MLLLHPPTHAIYPTHHIISLLPLRYVDAMNSEQANIKVLVGLTPAIYSILRLLIESCRHNTNGLGLGVCCGWNVASEEGCQEELLCLCLYQYETVNSLRRSIRQITTRCRKKSFEVQV